MAILIWVHGKGYIFANIETMLRVEGPYYSVSHTLLTMNIIIALAGVLKTQKNLLDMAV